MNKTRTLEFYMNAKADDGTIYSVFKDPDENFVYTMLSSEQKDELLSLKLTPEHFYIVTYTDSKTRPAGTEESDAILYRLVSVLSYEENIDHTFNLLLP